MLKLKSKMFEESRKSTASENVIVNIFVFLLVFLLIIVAEAVIPTIMSLPEIRERAAELGTTDLKEMYKISTEVSMQAKYLIPTLFCTAFGTLISIVHCRFFEARYVSSMGFRKKNMLLNYARGIGVGLLMMSLIVILTLIFGAEKISACKNVNFGLIILFFLGFMFQGMSEEVIFRGYLMNTIGARHDPYIAIIISSVAFSLAHLSNPGFNILSFLNLTGFGVFAGLYMIAYDNIWGVSAIHSIWNFTQGCIYGISVSGTGETESIFRTTAKSSSAILTGGDFGIEGSIMTTVVLAGGIALLILKLKKQENDVPEKTS